MDINLRFIRNEGFVSKAIGWQTWGPGGIWSHVEFVVGDGYLGSQAPDGVLLRPKTYCTPSEQLLCSVVVPDAVGAQVLAFAHAQIGKPYDYKSILGFVLRRDWRDTSAWFCSELVAAAFVYAGFPLLRTTEVNRVSPSTLSLSPYLQVDSRTSASDYTAPEPASIISGVSVAGTSTPAASATGFSCDW